MVFVRASVTFARRASRATAYFAVASCPIAIRPITPGVCAVIARPATGRRVGPVAVLVDTVVRTVTRARVD